MNKEAIEILTSEPCVSWLRERWTHQEADPFVNIGYKELQYPEDGPPAVWYVGPFCEPQATAYWLPRVGDFLTKGGLFEQAGIYKLQYELDCTREGRTQLTFELQKLGIGRSYQGIDLFLFCAQALQWLLERQEVP